MANVNNFAKCISFDAETNGLWGKAFAISAVLREEDGTTKEFLGRCPISEDINPWVAENVLPQMQQFLETAASYEELLRQFFAFYMENKDGSTILVHMGLPVEARLFIDAHNMGIIGDWDAPYPLVDIAAFPQIHDSVDSYNRNHGIVVPDMEGGTHNPLYDSWAALLAYEHINKGERYSLIREDEEGCLSHIGDFLSLIDAQEAMRQGLEERLEDIKECGDDILHHEVEDKSAEIIFGACSYV